MGKASTTVRPMHNKLYALGSFFLDIEGHRAEPHVAKALEEVRGRAAFFKVLGSYPRAVM